MTNYHNGNINITVNVYLQGESGGCDDDRLNDRINGKRQPWREKKRNTLRVAGAYQSMGELHYKRAGRIRWCGTDLGFVDGILWSANFCRERLCPMCQWRKSIKTFYQLSRVMDAAQDENPDTEALFLTLTVRSCSGEVLHDLVSTMFDGWANFQRHRRFKGAVTGWFRALEVTYNAEADTYHPHFHVMLLVDKSYYRSKYYLQTHEWVHMWRVSCDLDYDPICDIRAVKNANTRKRKHIAEVAKYTVKESDFVHDDAERTRAVVEVLTMALRKRRLFAYGGLLGRVYKRLNFKDPEVADLVNIDEDATIREDVAEALVIYRWDFGLSDYVRRGE